MSATQTGWAAAAAAALLLAEAAALLGWHADIPPFWLVLLWAQWAGTLVFLSRAGLWRFFGPVLFYDIVRTTRRPRGFLYRFLYVGLLFLLLCWVAFLWTFDRSRIDAAQMARFAESFVYTLLSVQFVAASVLTPAYTAGAIAEEKERKTIQFILATDLGSREIVLGKLLSRLGNLALLLLAGLPVLSALQFLGGVDPGLVLAAFAATAVTALSLGSLGILNSVLLNKPRDAVVATYAGGLGYLLLSSFAQGLAAWPNIMGFPATFIPLCPVTVADLVDLVGVGNIFLALSQVGGAARTGALGTELPVLLRNYALFHVVVAVALLACSAMWLRPIALREGVVKKVARQRLWTRLRGRPPVSDPAMVWKEVHAEPGVKGTWASRLLSAALVGLSLTPVAFMIADTWNARHYDLDKPMNIWVRVAGTAVACLLLLSVGTHAAGRITGERERQTFDSLLTTPLDSDDILYGKWVGSLFSVRWGWFWLGGIWFLGLITFGLNLLALPLLLGAWWVFAAFVAMLGLWFSTVCRTTMTATIATLLTTIGVTTGHWLIWMCCGPLFAYGGGRGADALTMIWMFQGFALTPPATLAFLAFHGGEFNEAYNSRRPALEMLGCSVIGLIIWGCAAMWLWHMTSARLREKTGRVPIRKPADHD